MTLKELQIGKSAIVDAVGGAGALRQHFLDMGLIPGAEVTLVKLCLLYTSPSPRDGRRSRMPSSA